MSRAPEISRHHLTIRVTSRGNRAPTSARASAEDLRASNLDREAVAQRLSQPLIDLFRQLTGFRLHTCWENEAPRLPHTDLPILCPTARARLGKGRTRWAECAACQRKQWTVVTSDGRLSRRFSGHCGSLNFCTRLPVATDSCLALLIQLRKPRTGDSERFSCAVALLELIARDVGSAVEMARLRHEAARLRDRLQQISAEEHRLRGELHERFPELPEKDPERTHGSHYQEIVSAMQRYVLAHYHRPLQLGDVAAALRMNPSYLSTLFSRTTGVTFHHYLEELRLAKAKELLSNPANRVSEVACAVGYASASQFRHVFKQRTGVAPHLWHTER